MKSDELKTKKTIDHSKEFEILIEEIFIDKVKSISNENKTSINKEFETEIKNIKRSIRDYFEEEIDFNSKFEENKEHHTNTLTTQSKQIIQKIETDISELKKENNTSLVEIKQDLEKNKQFINTENEKRIQNLLTQISNLKDKQSYALDEIKKDSESKNLILVKKNNEITDSLLARLDTMEIEMRKTKKINFILISIAIGLLILLSGFQIYFKQ